MPPPEEKRGDTEEEPVAKVDRRASREELHEPEQPTEQAPEERAESADAAATEEAPQPPEEGPGEGVPELTIYSLLRMFVGMVVQQAWVHLGVQIDQASRKLVQDLPKAKTAIDVLAALVQHLQPDLDGSEKRELERALADLRINYTQRV